MMGYDSRKVKVRISSTNALLDDVDRYAAAKTRQRSADNMRARARANWRAKARGGNANQAEEETGINYEAPTASRQAPTTAEWASCPTSSARKHSIS